ncbi:MAG TPA: hypothetical protein PKI59_09200, partial [Candidatus Cloacimonadota bacterium]|nr:hypothetical protein [Candidatus Cloacimonadota bacterium]
MRTSKSFNSQTKIIKAVVIDVPQGSSTKLRYSSIVKGSIVNIIRLSGWNFFAIEHIEAEMIACFSWNGT